MSGFGVALRKELLEQWRSYRLLVLVVVMAAFGLLSPLTAKYTPELIKLLPRGDAMAALIPPPTAMDAIAQYLKNIGQFGVLLALLLTMGAVAQEKDRGTAALILVKPLSRAAFLAAKFAAQTLCFGAAIAVAAVTCYYYTYLLFGAIDVPRWLALNGLLLVYIVVYVAVTLLTSVLTKSQAAAGGLAFGFLILLALAGAIPGVGEFLPGQLIAWSGLLMAGQRVTFWPALGVSVGLIAVALVTAWRRFESQEL